MKNFVTTGILSLALLLSSEPEGKAYQGDVGAAGPLTFWYSSNPEVIIPALECVVERYRAATCLPLDVSVDAAHWVRLAPASAMGGRVGWTTGGSWNQTQVKLLDTLTPAQLCPLLMHEVSHILRRSNDHPAPNGSFSSPAVHVVATPVSHITAEDIALICAVQSCGCSNPEP